MDKASILTEQSLNTDGQSLNSNRAELNTMDRAFIQIEQSLNTDGESLDTN